MSERRKITVQKVSQAWQEYDREILVELWHNAYETTTLRLSPDEASSLRQGLTDFLGAQGGTR